MPNAGADFDREVRALVEPYVLDGRLTAGIDSDIHWGRPN
jgi:hypothetical protein